MPAGIAMNFCTPRSSLHSIITSSKDRMLISPPEIPCFLGSAKVDMNCRSDSIPVSSSGPQRWKTASSSMSFNSSPVPSVWNPLMKSPRESIACSLPGVNSVNASNGSWKCRPRRILARTIGSSITVLQSQAR